MLANTRSSPTCANAGPINAADDGMAVYLPWSWFERDSRWPPALLVTGADVRQD
jgi:hypothetical protein